MSSGNGLNVNEIIDKLLEVRGYKPGPKVNLSEDEIKGLCQKSREIFMSQPILLELEAPIKICKFYALIDFISLFSYCDFRRW